MVDRLKEVVGKSEAAVGPAYQTDIPVRTSVQHGLLVNLVVHSDKPGVFMDCGRGGTCEQIGIGQRIRRIICLIGEAPIGGNKDGITASDGTGRCPPRKGLQNGTHLRRRSQSSLLSGGVGYKHL